MLVVDSEKSERYRQRRRTDDGRLMHCCCMCGNVDVWGATWSHYSSWLELDEEKPIAKFCSSECADKAGPECQNVTRAMKKAAKDAEWREPKVAYREATDREKYDHAAHKQRHKTT